MGKAIDIWSILTIVVRVAILSVGNTIDYVAWFVDYNVSSPEKCFNWLIDGKQYNPLYLISYIYSQQP